jgi:transposase
MNEHDIISLGLGIQSPWHIVGQLLDTSVNPQELKIRLKADRGSEFPCPDCDQMCKAHDFREKTWRHLNFFQHHCYITAHVPRTNCPEHGVKSINVPWARKGSHFTLLFEQAAMTLVREMPVLAAARIMEISDKSLWRIVFHYVNGAISKMDLSNISGIAVDETSSGKRHQYVTIFIDVDAAEKPVLFVVPGKGKDTIEAFKKFLQDHQGKAGNIARVVCDMSPAFISGAEENFENAVVVVDWFHVVKLFTKAVDEVRREESQRCKMRQGTRWAVLKAEDNLSEEQKELLAQLESYAHYTAQAWRIKEMLRWINSAETSQAATWRFTHFLNYVKEIVEDVEILKPVHKAIGTLKKHKDRILSRWGNDYSNGRLEGLNGLFQAARARARGYRNVQTFITMIYLIAAPIEQILKST